MLFDQAADETTINKNILETQESDGIILRPSDFNLESKLIVPTLLDYDEKQVVLEFSDGKRTCFTFNEKIDDNFGIDFQGAFKIKSNNEIIQFRSEPSEYNEFFGFNKDGNNISEFYLYNPSSLANIPETYGNIPHRIVNTEYRGSGIAAFSFGRLERMLKIFGHQTAVVGTLKPEVFKLFLEKAGYTQSETPKYTLHATAEFLKDLTNLPADEMDNYSKYIKFPVKVSNKLQDFIMPIKQIILPNQA